MGTTETETYYGIVAAGLVFLVIILSMLVIVAHQLWRINIMNKRWFDEQIIGLEKASSRIAKDLHDDIGSTLYAVRLKMGAIQAADKKSAQRVEEALMMLGVSSEKIKQICRKMLPLNLPESGLVDAVKSYLLPLQMESATEIIFDAEPIEALPEKTALHLYRIVQELVHNALKHAAAKRICVDIIQIKDHLYITVIDDGNGFDYRRHQRQHSNGLSNIKNRVAYMGGYVHFITKPGKGCKCEIRIKNQQSLKLSNYDNSEHPFQENIASKKNPNTYS